MKTIDQVIDDTVPSSITTILKDSGVNINEAPVSNSHYDVIAVIGFSGSGFGGAVGFAAEKSILNAAYGESDTLLSDGWVGEVANQLLGRMKNYLLSYGVVVEISIPMVLHGLELQVRVKTSQIKQYEYTSEYGHTCVWVDANWDYNQELELAASEEHAQSEGITLMF